MCIIIVKPAGVNLPTKKIIKSCFRSNPDGAGIMFSYDGEVRIEKGFMGFKSFWKYHQRMEFDKSVPIVYHFRIATAGGTSPGNCHPFPISDSEDLLKSPSVRGEKIAIVHNGILPIKTPLFLSDTQIFIRDTLSGVRNELIAKNPAVLTLLEMSTKGSRLALLYSDGSIIMQGSGWVPDGSGLVFSNDSYLPRTVWYDSFPFEKDTPPASNEFCDVCGQVLEIWGDDHYCQQCDTVKTYPIFERSNMEIEKIEP